MLKVDKLKINEEITEMKAISMAQTYLKKHIHGGKYIKAENGVIYYTILDQEGQCDLNFFKLRTERSLEKKVALLEGVIYKGETK